MASISQNASAAVLPLLRAYWRRARSGELENENIRKSDILATRARLEPLMDSSHARAYCGATADLHLPAVLWAVYPASAAHPVLRLRQKTVLSRPCNWQYGAWFVLDHDQNSRCGGFCAPDCSQTREHDLFQYPSEFAASILRAEKQRTTRVDSGLGSKSDCGTYSCFSARVNSGPPALYKYWSASRLSFTRPTTHRPLRLLNGQHLSCGFQPVLDAVSHAHGALTAVVGSDALGILLTALRDRVLADADALTLSHSVSVSLGGTVRTRDPRTSPRRSPGNLAVSARTRGQPTADPAALALAGILPRLIDFLAPIARRHRQRDPTCALPRLPGTRLRAPLLDTGATRSPRATCHAHASTAAFQSLTRLVCSGALRTHRAPSPCRNSRCVPSAAGVHLDPPRSARFSIGIIAPLRISLDFEPTIDVVELLRISGTMERAVPDLTSMVFKSEAQRSLVCLQTSRTLCSLSLPHEPRTSIEPIAQFRLCLKAAIGAALKSKPLLLAAAQQCPHLYRTYCSFRSCPKSVRYWAPSLGCSGAIGVALKPSAPLFDFEQAKGFAALRCPTNPEPLSNLLPSLRFRLCINKAIGVALKALPRLTSNQPTASLPFAAPRTPDLYRTYSPSVRYWAPSLGSSEAIGVASKISTLRAFVSEAQRSLVCLRTSQGLRVPSLPHTPRTSIEPIAQFRINPKSDGGRRWAGGVASMTSVLWTSRPERGAAELVGFEPVEGLEARPRPSRILTLYVGAGRRGSGDGDGDGDGDEGRWGGLERYRSPSPVGVKPESACVGTCRVEARRVGIRVCVGCAQAARLTLRQPRAPLSGIREVFGATDLSLCGLRFMWGAWIDLNERRDLNSNAFNSGRRADRLERRIHFNPNCYLDFNSPASIDFKLSIAPRRRQAARLRVVRVCAVHRGVGGSPAVGWGIRDRPQAASSTTTARLHSSGSSCPLSPDVDVPPPCYQNPRCSQQTLQVLTAAPNTPTPARPTRPDTIPGCARQVERAPLDSHTPRHRRYVRPFAPPYGSPVTPRPAHTRATSPSALSQPNAPRGAHRSPLDPATASISLPTGARLGPDAASSLIMRLPAHPPVPPPPPPPRESATPCAAHAAPPANPRVGMRARLRANYSNLFAPAKDAISGPHDSRCHLPTGNDLVTEWRSGL
ncbi:hypothetical protein B0H15DRAFT_806610 [Mycena belliarum]|uniref:Uncharacterized protein n=1 Tax=Mycena belliarum TaxID=1033014 RepID=A0AAD6TPG5_9AGAR|nr:hypothetical protein B0H15DRAFT_806610 [Mycena belliae]